MQDQEIGCTTRGIITKMSTALADAVQYSLVLDEKLILLNPYIGKTISLHFTGKIKCFGCDNIIKKSYQQGYCFMCTQRLARCDMCIVKPELCHFAAGTCREPEWGEQHCMTPHIIYLANSSGIKVGITRENQVPTRWIDQGAVAALPIMRTKTRYQSGLIEVQLAKLVGDKTNWRKMLSGVAPEVDFAATRDWLWGEIMPEIQKIAAKFPLGDIELLTAEQQVNITYPVLQYPDKVNSLKFTKTPQITGTLQGIKGQYLILDHGVLNLRNCSGYEIIFAA